MFYYSNEGWWCNQTNKEKEENRVLFAHNYIHLDLLLTLVRRGLQIFAKQSVFPTLSHRVGI